MRQAVTLLAVAMCAYAVCTVYDKASGQSRVELVQKSNIAHAKHLIHAAKSMQVCLRALPEARGGRVGPGGRHERSALASALCCRVSTHAMREFSRKHGASQSDA